MQPLHNFPEPIKHIISMKFQSVYPFLYYAKLLHRFTANITKCLQACRVGLRQTLHNVYKLAELFFASCDVVQPMHNFPEPIMHIISMKFQCVYPLLYYAKLKPFCTGLRQTYQNVYKLVELFFASCDVMQPLHNFLEPIMHIISMKFQSVYSFLYYTKLLHRFTANITKCLQACRVVFC